MVRLAYIFWAVGLVWLVGCGPQEPEMVRIYRPEVLRQETATPRPASLLFDAPELARVALPESALGATVLNLRPTQVVIDGYQAGPEIIRYNLRYYDRHPDGRHGWRGGWRHGGHGHGYLHRSFRYEEYGAFYR